MVSKVPLVASAVGSDNRSSIQFHVIRHSPKRLLELLALAKAEICRPRSLYLSTIKVRAIRHSRFTVVFGWSFCVGHDALGIGLTQRHRKIGVSNDEPICRFTRCPDTGRKPNAVCQKPRILNAVLRQADGWPMSRSFSSKASPCNQGVTLQLKRVSHPPVLGRVGNLRFLLTIRLVC